MSLGAINSASLSTCFRRAYLCWRRSKSLTLDIRKPGIVVVLKYIWSKQWKYEEHIDQYFKYFWSSRHQHNSACHEVHNGVKGWPLKQLWGCVQSWKSGPGRFPSFHISRGGK